MYVYVCVCVYVCMYTQVSSMIVVILMMIKQLLTFIALLIISIVAFSSAEYLAYSYTEQYGYNFMLSFLVRTYEMFVGVDYVTHMVNNRVMGALYSILFVLVANLLLMNLIIALLTTAYESAVEQTGNTHWATLQFQMLKRDLIKHQFHVEEEKGCWYNPLITP